MLSTLLMLVFCSVSNPGECHTTTIETTTVPAMMPAFQCMAMAQVEAANLGPDNWIVMETKCSSRPDEQIEGEQTIAGK